MQSGCVYCKLGAIVAAGVSKMTSIVYNVGHVISWQPNKSSLLHTDTWVLKADQGGQEG